MLGQGYVPLLPGAAPISAIAASGMLGQGCPTDAPMPPGYSPWTGSITPEMQRFAHSIVSHPSVKYGDIFFSSFDGVPVAARLEHHTFTVLADGSQVPGCYRGGTLYHPPTATITPGSSKSWLDLLVIASVLFGTTFAVGSAVMRAFQERRDREQQTREELAAKGMLHETHND